MQTVWICFALFSTLVTFSGAISVIITPENELVVMQGGNISLQCTLKNLSSTHTAEDIMWYKDNVLLESSLSNAVNGNTSQLTVANATFDDSGIYGCGFMEDSYSDLALIVVTVALPPSGVQNLACKSYNVLDIYCTWEDGAVETNTQNIHKPQFRYYGRQTLQDVDEYTIHSCQFRVTAKTNVFVRVTTTNSLGSAVEEVLFDSQEQVTPHPPESVTARPDTTNGNTVLLVEWGYPSDWLHSYSLQYRVHYRREGSSEVKEKLVPSGFRWTRLENLKHSTKYLIEVSAKSPVASDQYWGEPGITEASTESIIISPENELFVTQGGNISLQCTLHNFNSLTHTAEDILWYKDNVLLESSLSNAINGNTSQLTVANAAFDDSGIYGCGFMEDSYSDRVLIVVTVALPPSEVQNLACKSYNVADIYCTWEEGAVETNTRNIHKPQFRYYGKQTLEDVDEYTDYSCQFEATFKTNVFVRVTTTNSLGSAMVEVNFDSERQVTPHAPERIMAEPHPTNGSTCLSVSWENPSDWKYYYSLGYRVHYSREGSSEVKEKPVDSGFRHTVLEDLNPSTKYLIEVSAKFVTADDWGEPGRTEASTLDGAPFGKVSGLNLQSEANSEKSGFRHVELQWKAPPRHEWGSKSLNYTVYLIPQDHSPGRSQDKHKDTTIMPSLLVHDVSKYQTYSVEITPFNNEGAGPVTTFQEAIPDRTSAPGRPSRLNVTLISDTLQITWEPPKNPNGIIYAYDVLITGSGVIFSNTSDDTGEEVVRIRTESQVVNKHMNCTKFTENGLPVEVMVAALTRNYTGYIFQGDWEKFTQDGVCKIKDEGPNALFIGIFIPCSIIISCIIALCIWNFFKDACVQPPEIHISNKIKCNKDGHLGIPNKPFITGNQEKEQFDDLKPWRDTRDMSIDLTGGQQTFSNSYQNPRSQPKNTIERINSHDSGMPESPVSQCGDVMEFYNKGFVEESMDVQPEPVQSVDVKPEPIQSISRNVSSGKPDEVSTLFRLSGISNISEDSGADVTVKEDGIVLDSRPTSSSTDELPSPDPYFKVSALPSLSSRSTNDFPSPYIKAPVGQDGKIPNGEVIKEEDEFDENDCPFDDADSNSGYLKQYQLGSPTSLTSEPPPYMAMTPISPPPVSTCVPNGYVPAESLPRPAKSNTGGALDQNGYVPEEYSAMVDSQAGNVGGCHPSLLSFDGNYLDNYPDFNQNVPPGPTLGPTIASTLGSGGYVQQKDIPTSPISQEPAYIPNRSENSNQSEMPYSKLAVSDLS